MTGIRPFRALRYDPARVDFSRVIAPPYDVIPAEERGVLYDRDPHNAIRLELTREVEDEASTDYAEIRETLAAWRASGVLLREAAPALYAVRQGFAAPDGSRLVRESFFALLHLEDYARRIVRPHERTLAGPKADRLKVLRAARANLSPVLLLYEDREQALAPLLRAAAPRVLCEAREESGATHELARVDAPEALRAAAEFLAERPVVIADGHHRYETALAYRDERRAAGDAAPDAPHEWILACFANAFAPGTLLLPIHRLVCKGSAPTPAAWRERLPGWSVRELPLPDPARIDAVLAQQLAPLAPDRHAFAVDDASGVLRILSRAAAPGELGVRVLHREVIEGVFGLDEAAVREGAIAYPKSAGQTARDLRAGRGVVALYLNPLRPDDVFRVTAAGEVLP
ncbi:MAG TPA: DUF1015 domain-containing protein, partial [Myxococcota bacterium]|nr:DUF1015 domain-containing protein [Myxococcota bacterium]